MHEIKNDAFYDLAEKYDSDSENHYVGESDIILYLKTGPMKEKILIGKLCASFLTGCLKKALSMTKKPAEHKAAELPVSCFL